MPDRKNPNKPPHRAQSLRHLASSVERTKRILARWPDAEHIDVNIPAMTKALATAQKLLSGVAEQLDKLPPNYPPRRIAATALIQPDAVVTVKDQYRDKYKALIPSKELDELTVVSVNEHSLTFKTKSGIVSIAPKRYVKAVEA